jgi:hypothetical protein
VVPLVLVALVRGPAPQRVLALGGLSYLVLLAARLGYSPDEPRLLLPAAALVSPLLGGVEGHPWRRRAMVAVALAGVVPTLTLNTNKPLLRRGVPSVLRADRIEAQLIDRDQTDQQYVLAIKALNRSLPTGGKLGVVGRDYFPSYVLIDPGLHREVIHLAPTQLDPAWLRRRGFVGAFIWPTDPEDCVDMGCSAAPLPADAMRLPGGTAFLFAATNP